MFFLAQDDIIKHLGRYFTQFADVVIAPFPPLIYPCRPVALKRCFRNLIENAVRYGGNALVSAVTQQDAVTIAVEDDGPGVPPDQIEDAFQPFVRLEPSRSPETGGACAQPSREEARAGIRPGREKA